MPVLARAEHKGGPTTGHVAGMKTVTPLYPVLLHPLTLPTVRVTNQLKTVASVISKM